MVRAYVVGITNLHTSSVLYQYRGTVWSLCSCSAAICTTLTLFEFQAFMPRAPPAVNRLLMPDPHWVRKNASLIPRLRVELIDKQHMQSDCSQLLGRYLNMISLADYHVDVTIQLHARGRWIVPSNILANKVHSFRAPCTLSLNLQLPNEEITVASEARTLLTKLETLYSGDFARKWH